MTYVLHLERLTARTPGCAGGTFRRALTVFPDKDLAAIELNVGQLPHCPFSVCGRCELDHRTASTAPATRCEDFSRSHRPSLAHEVLEPLPTDAVGQIAHVYAPLLRLLCVDHTA